MDDLIKSLPSLLRFAGDANEVREAAVMAAWRHAAGEGLRNHAVPETFDDRKLVVAVADAVWQKQLGAMTGQMLYRINSILGESVVGRIELRIDSKIAALRSRPAREPNRVSNNEVPLELWAAANAIQDKHLRQSFLRAATCSMKRRAQNHEP